MVRKFTLSVAVLLSLLTIVACGGGSSSSISSSGNNGSNATSQLCANITGAEAILWDSLNGVIRTDTDVLPPPVPFFTGNNLFFHPNFPPLSFVFPDNWTAVILDGGVGVEVLRFDSQAIYRNFQRTVQGLPAAINVRDAEIQGLLQFFGLSNAPIQTVCEFQGTSPLGGGITSEFSNIMFRAGDHTAVITAAVFPLPGLSTASATRKVVSAPTAEFPVRAIDTFLAIEFQQLFTDNPQLKTQCNDGMDNDLDALTDFPNDPQCLSREDNNESIL